MIVSSRFAGEEPLKLRSVGFVVMGLGEIDRARLIQRLVHDRPVIPSISGCPEWLLPGPDIPTAYVPKESIQIVEVSE